MIYAFIIAESGKFRDSRIRRKAQKPAFFHTLLTKFACHCQSAPKRSVQSLFSRFSLL